MKKAPAAADAFCGRSVGIRTRGLLDPNQARYQASPHPVSLFIIVAFRAFVKHKSLPLWGRCPRRGRMRALSVTAKAVPAPPEGEPSLASLFEGGG